MNAPSNLSITPAWDTPQQLISFLSARHHSSIRRTLTHLEKLSDLIAREKLVPPNVMDHLQREFAIMVELLRMNLAQQGNWLFPMIYQLRERAGAASRDEAVRENVAEAIDVITLANHEAMERIDRVQMCLGDESWAGKGRLVEELIDKMQALEEDVATYFRLEADVLFPRVREHLSEAGFAS